MQDGVRKSHWPDSGHLRRPSPSWLGRVGECVAAETMLAKSRKFTQKTLSLMSLLEAICHGYIALFVFDRVSADHFSASVWAVEYEKPLGASGSAKVDGGSQRPPPKNPSSIEWAKMGVRAVAEQGLEPESHLFLTQRLRSAHSCLHPYPGSLYRPLDPCSRALETIPASPSAFWPEERVAKAEMVTVPAPPPAHPLCSLSKG
ncbi:uncharacterized protein VTP21DRAFT_3442 [Calcarisporiella thermophila]|uniref:uncharacterized protein n=1 Tax=Calcarisporiella thermophila TaxID=911321 RepID=UPI00374409D5